MSEGKKDIRGEFSKREGLLGKGIRWLITSNTEKTTCNNMEKNVKDAAKAAIDGCRSVVKKEFVTDDLHVRRKSDVNEVSHREFTTKKKGGSSSETKVDPSPTDFGLVETETSVVHETGVQQAEFTEQTSVEIGKALERRYLLEQQIVPLIGGTGGIQIILRRLENAAKQYDSIDFEAYRSLYTEKADTLRKFFQELRETKEIKVWNIPEESEELYRALKQNVRDASLYERLLKLDDFLRETCSGHINKEKMDAFLAESERLCADFADTERRDWDAIPKDAKNQKENY